MFRLIYNLFLPVGFLFFLPGMILKYRNRPGWKDTFAERFGIFSPERIEELKKFQGAIWIHAVSVGEAVVAMSLVNALLKRHPEQKAVISTTTTTGQELARKNAPANVAVIFCPIDFPWMVKRTFSVFNPSMLVIFETEIWPNLIAEACRRNVPRLLVNGRMSDHSVRGYRKIKAFFGPLLAQFSAILVQTEADKERYLSVSPNAEVECAGNIKFDQKAPGNLPDAGYSDCFGTGKNLILLAASTHPGEEEVVLHAFEELKKGFANLKLVLVPRHAERGNDIAALLEKERVSYSRRSLGGKPEKTVDVLLADTTGEMLKLMNGADVVIMGKSLAGHDEGHNLIEPALLSKPVVTGSVLRNFRYILNVLLSENAVLTVSSDAELVPALQKLLSDESLRLELGRRAEKTISRNAGAVERTLNKMDELLS